MTHTTSYRPAADSTACECGEATGVACAWTGPDAVTVEWVPEFLRASHVAARNWGTYPANGAVRLRVSPECAALLREGHNDPDEPPYARLVG